MKQRNKKIREISGERFGRLVAQSFSHTRKGRSYWHCLCDCGTTTVVQANRLRCKQTFSCGCLLVDFCKSRATHGKSKHNLYTIWSNMKSRCNDPAQPAYPRYGGRGIKVCSRWETFDNFYSDMFPRPPRHQIDRIDNDGDYEPSNCHWVTCAENAVNKSNTLFVEYMGKRLILRDWSKLVGIPANTLFYRYKYAKWSIERVLTTPIKGRLK